MVVLGALMNRRPLPICGCSRPSSAVASISFTEYTLASFIQLVGLGFRLAQDDAWDNIFEEPAKEESLPSLSPGPKKPGGPPPSPFSGGDDGGPAAKKAKKAAPQLAQMCIMGDGKPRYCRMRFCQYHKQIMDIAFYQADHPKDGEEACGKEVKKALEDDEVAIEVCRLYEKNMPADSSLGKKQKKGGAPRFVHTAQFRKRFGVRMSKRTVESEKPTEEIEFISNMERKGWPKAEAKAEWKRVSSRAEVADHKGLRGATRYWIELDSVRERVKEIFIDSGVDQTGDLMKGVKGSQLDSMKRFAHSTAADQGDEFFTGESTLGHNDDVFGTLLGIGQSKKPTEGASGSEIETAKEVVIVSMFGSHVFG